MTARESRKRILPVSWSSIHSTKDSMSRLLFAIVASFSGMKDMFLSSMTSAFGKRKEETGLYAAKNHDAFEKEKSMLNDEPSSGGQISVVLTSYNLDKMASKSLKSRGSKRHTILKWIYAEFAASRTHPTPHKLCHWNAQTSS